VRADRDEVAGLEGRALEDPLAVEVRAALGAEVGGDELVAGARRLV
jgi:hypothetical protein